MTLLTSKISSQLPKGVAGFKRPTEVGWLVDPGLLAVVAGALVVGVLVVFGVFLSLPVDIGICW